MLFCGLASVGEMLGVFEHTFHTGCQDPNIGLQHHRIMVTGYFVYFNIGGPFSPIIVMVKIIAIFADKTIAHLPPWDERGSKQGQWPIPRGDLIGLYAFKEGVLDGEVVELLSLGGGFH